ncbi:hypothetical protein [Catenulispora sp. MAP5-51]|uniref:hypothetical protein n=1 Tax=unclassified Catenulispora TaxID=414885 RepID=UPI0035162E87
MAEPDVVCPSVRATDTTTPLTPAAEECAWSATVTCTEAGLAPLRTLADSGADEAAAPISTGVPGTRDNDAGDVAAPATAAVFADGIEMSTAAAAGNTGGVTTAPLGIAGDFTGWADHGLPGVDTPRSKA